MSASPTPLRLAILNDYEVIVAGLAAVLSAQDPRIRVIELNTRVPSVSDIDIVLLDTFAFASGGLIQVRELVQQASRSGAKVVVYSWVTDQESIRGALSDGAAGHLWKGLGASELVEALEAIRSGDVVTRGPDPTPVPGEEPADPEQARWPGQAVGLSAREAEVVALIAKGMSNEDIARELYLGVNTIKTYIRTAYRTIGVTSRTQAVLWAIQNGFDLNATRVFPSSSSSPVRSSPPQSRVTAVRRDADRTPSVPSRAPGATASAYPRPGAAPSRSADLGAELGRRAEHVRSLVPALIGLTLVSLQDATPFTVAATSDEVAALDAAQYLAGGPCLAAITAGRVVSCHQGDLERTPAWRRFAIVAAGAGVSGTSSLPLALDGRVVGTINLYAASHDGLDASRSAVADQFRQWAPRVAAEARLPERRVKTETQPQHLRDDVDIKAATARLAERRSIPLQRARLHLDDAAHRAGITKAALARAVLLTADSAEPH